MSKFDITLEDHGPHGRYVGRIPGKDGEAEITFTRRSPTLVSYDHIGSPDTLRGTGIAMALTERIVADARAGGFKIIPRCPYARAQYEKHPEWADVMTTAAGSK